MICLEQELINSQSKNESKNWCKISTQDLNQQNLVADWTLINQKYIDSNSPTELLVLTDAQKKNDYIENNNENYNVNLMQNSELTYENENFINE